MSQGLYSRSLLWLVGGLAAVDAEAPPCSPRRYDKPAGLPRPRKLRDAALLRLAHGAALERGVRAAASGPALDDGLGTALADGGRAAGPLRTLVGSGHSVSLGSPCSSISTTGTSTSKPSRSTSPGPSGVGAVTWRPFTKVRFLDPRSFDQQKVGVPVQPRVATADLVVVGQPADVRAVELVPSKPQAVGLHHEQVAEQPQRDRRSTPGRLAGRGPVGVLVHRAGVAPSAGAPGCGQGASAGGSTRTGSSFTLCFSHDRKVGHGLR